MCHAVSAEQSLQNHGIITHCLPEAALTLFVTLTLALTLRCRHDPQHLDGALYLLMSDQGYLREPHVVWERLSGIDGDTAFYQARPYAQNPVRGSA